MTIGKAEPMRIEYDENRHSATMGVADRQVMVDRNIAWVLCVRETSKMISINHVSIMFLIHLEFRICLSPQQASNLM